MMPGCRGRRWRAALLLLCLATAAADRARSDEVMPSGMTDEDELVSYGSMGGYMTFDEVVNYMDDLHANSPHLVTAKKSVGKSFEGRAMWVFCVGKCSGSGAPEALYNSMIHAREPMALAQLVFFVNKLLHLHEHNDAQAQALLATRALWILPVLNPDAYVKNAEALPNGGGMYRKNRNSACSGDERHGGVDLNRNFPICFKIDDIGSSDDPCAEDYRGPAPFSEPESQALRSLVQSHSFSISLNFHSFGRFINQPWMCESRGDNKDEIFFSRFGHVATGKDKHGWAYGHPWSKYLYSVNGAVSDWMYKDHGIMAMAPEVGPECMTCQRVSDRQGFWPARDKILGLSQEVWPLNIETAWVAGPLLSLHKTARMKGSCESMTVTVKAVNEGLRDMKQAPTLSIITAAAHEIEATIGDAVSAARQLSGHLRMAEAPRRMGATLSADPSTLKRLSVLEADTDGASHGDEAETKWENVQACDGRVVLVAARGAGHCAVFRLENDETHLVKRLPESACDYFESGGGDSTSAVQKQHGLALAAVGGNIRGTGAFERQGSLPLLAAGAAVVAVLAAVLTRGRRGASAAAPALPVEQLALTVQDDGVAASNDSAPGFAPVRAI